MASQNDAKAYEFVMSFVAASEQYREQFVGKWQEIVSNFIVSPDEPVGATSTPYTKSYIHRNSRNNIVLKDPETHKLVMTYASKLVRALLGDSRREYIQSTPVGYEDARKAQTVTKLLRYSFSLPGMFRSLVEAVVDMLLFGTSVVEVIWDYQEREMPVRSVTSSFGIETSEFIRVPIPVYDDVTIRPVDVNSFYPDPSRYRMQDMTGAAKGFKMNTIEARRMASAGVYSSAAVEKAIIGGVGASDAREPSFRAGLDQPETVQPVPEFGEMIGYEYWGDVPWNGDDGGRRVITILNNEVVRNEPYPLADPSLPFHTLIINPVQGRFYGVSPAEVVRFDQSFADAMKILLAEAIIRQVHPPVAFDPDNVDDPAAIQAWLTNLKPDILLPARGGPNSIGTLQYGANVANGFAMLQGTKIGIQDASGALGGIQGEPGPSRESASVGMQRLQFAMDRPELAGMVLENECLPPIGKAILRRYQQFLQDTEDLKKRVGELPDPIWIGDVMGDFDVAFMGSRQVANRQAKLQAFDRLVSYAQVVPSFQAILPNQDIATFVIGELLELTEVAAKIGNPQDVMRNLVAMQMFGQGGAGNNGIASKPEPTGLMPAQTAGGINE